MSTSTIKPKRGTTQQWTDSKRILEEGEWGVEITTANKYILRIGDGSTEFMKLPEAVSTPYFEEIGKLMEAKYNEVMQFSKNMTEAANSANAAAGKATTEANKATAAADACKGAIAGMNTMIDDTQAKSYKLGVNAGKIYIQEV